MKGLARWISRLVWALVLLGLIWQAWYPACLLWWRQHNPESTAFMREHFSELQARQPDAVLYHRWVPYDAISEQLKRAVVAAEDAKFVDHDGFDWQGMQKALERNQRQGATVAGGSTISQQLAKNLFLSPSRSLWRKGNEAVITLLLENLWSKQRIFEVYLNVIEWGNGVFGAEAAARHYFNRSAQQLTAAQAARLAGMVPNPRYYDTHRNAPGLARKTAIILARMQAAKLPQ